MFESLCRLKFDVVYQSHAAAILIVDFPDVVDEISRVLEATTIPVEEIIASGGGEAKGTQRLRRALAHQGWGKGQFRIEKSINGVPRESISHEVDHIKTFALGNVIALEIEWNNKDPFFDRDLENYKRLHAEGAISLGIVITRGRSLQDGLPGIVRNFCDDRNIDGFEDLERWGYIPTPKQRVFITSQVARGREFRDAFTRKFVADKFGEATTHWRKLEDRLSRGVGNPCPLVCIGLPAGIVTMHEGQAALHEIDTEDHVE